MRTLATPRHAMLATVLETHTAAMAKLRAAYKDPSSQAVLDHLDQLELELSERLATRGGSASMRRGMGSGFIWFRIKLNARLLSDNPTELIPTYLHELAHIVANLMTGSNCGHGPIWAAVMAVLGLPAERCHKMDVSAYRRAPVRHVYACAKCSSQYRLTKHKHLKHQTNIAVGGRGYICRCGSPIVFQKTE